MDSKNHCRPVQVSLGHRMLLQTDQQVLADQIIRRHKLQCRTDPGLDSHDCHPSAEISHQQGKILLEPVQFGHHDQGLFLQQAGHEGVLGQALQIR